MIMREPVVIRDVYCNGCGRMVRAFIRPTPFLNDPVVWKMETHYESLWNPFNWSDCEFSGLYVLISEGSGDLSAAGASAG